MARDAKLITRLNVLRPFSWKNPSSKQLQAEHREHILEDVIPLSPCTSTVPLDKTKLSFFDLPPELRNHVYELLANQTILSLSTSYKTSSPPGPPTRSCGLLLTSKQCRREYLPLYLSTASVIIDIKDFDFRNLMRVVGSLYSTELKALRQNPSLSIRLWTNNCAREHLVLLRRWLQLRARGMDRLPWQYVAWLPSTSNPVSKVRQLRELNYYKYKLDEFHTKLEENMQWELQGIIDAFSKRIVQVKADLAHVEVPTAEQVRRQLRGLAGGGVM